MEVRLELYIQLTRGAVLCVGQVRGAGGRGGLERSANGISTTHEASETEKAPASLG